MDVINLISKDLSFPDDPAVTAGGLDNSLAVAANGPRVYEFLREKQIMRLQQVQNYFSRLRKRFRREASWRRPPARQ